MNAMLPIVGTSAISSDVSAGGAAPRSASPRRRWALPAAAILHGVLLLAVGRQVMRAPRPVADAGVPVIFVPAAVATSEMIAGAAVSPAHRVVSESLPLRMPPAARVAGVSPAAERVRTPVRRPADAAVAAAAVPRQAAAVLQARVAAAGRAIRAADDAAARDLLAALQARIRAAVQAAMIYPPSARMLRRQGRAEVGFTFADGAVSALLVAVSSGDRLLDGAALAAVRRAEMPRAPAGIGARGLPLLVWVNFSLVEGP